MQDRITVEECLTSQECEDVIASFDMDKKRACHVYTPERKSHVNKELNDSWFVPSKDGYKRVNELLQRVAEKFVDPLYDVKVLWWERPKLLYYPVGGHFGSHFDSHVKIVGDKHYRTQNRDITVTIFLNDDYEGGQFNFVKQDYTVNPTKGLGIFFPADYRFRHRVLPVTKGERFQLSTWFTVEGSPRTHDVSICGPLAETFPRKL